MLKQSAYFSAPHFLTLGLLLPGVLVGCASDPTESTLAEPAPETTAETATDTGVGTLVILANGEDFVRQGFVSKDGWSIQFDHVYVNLADITAYQTDPPFDPDGEEPLAATTEVTLEEAKVIDLAEGDEMADPIRVGELEAPAGRYNALSWRMMPAADGDAAGHTLMLVGKATKDGQTVDFTLAFDQPLAYACGDFVGEERKGILPADGEADLEATFHFDHLFGDGDAPPEDSINTGALGFEPFLAMAQGDQLVADKAAMATALSPEQDALLEEILVGLGHVGEGHCRAVEE